MSLLEDVFLQDEANEAEQLERVIEGDGWSDSDENSEKDDEAEEDKRKVDPKKPKTTRVSRNPRFLLNPARLTGPRGMQVIPEHFKDFKFKGKGHEKEDLDVVLKRLEHWAYRLYPKFKFEDCLKKIETLGKKRPVAVHLHKIRSDQFLSEDTVVQKDSSDEETPMPVQEEDEFDKLLQQQIELARSTPVPDLTKKPDYSMSVSPKDKRTTSLMMPKATSSPSINEEQRERMLRSRRLAEEKRLARMKMAENADTTETRGDSMSVNTNLYHTNQNSKSNMEPNEEKNEDSNGMAGKKNNRLNTIDSSDEETVEDTFVSVSADIHTANKIPDENNAAENEKSMHTINSDNQSDKGVKEIENETEESINCNSNTEKNCGNEVIAENEIIEKEIDDTDNNIYSVNSGTDNSNSNNINEKSDASEGLTYNISGMDIDLNEQNINEKNVMSSIKASESVEKNINSNDIEVSNIIDKEALCSSEDISNVENDKIINVSKENISEVMEDASNNTNVPEEVVEDIMDVDFTEDF